MNAIDWAGVAASLDAQGSAVIVRLLSPEKCEALVALYPSEDRFRSRVAMARHGFGRGEYKYFSYPLPKPIEGLRTALYAPLAQSLLPGAGTFGISHMTALDRGSGPPSSTGGGPSPLTPKAQLGIASSASGQNQPARNRRPVDVRKSRIIMVFLLASVLENRRRDARSHCTRV